MKSVPPGRLRVGFVAQLDPQMRARRRDPPATEPVKKTVRLESALVRLARNEVTWGKWTAYE